MDNQEYLKHVVAELNKPLEYKWKLQSYNKDKTKAMCVAYIDARIATNRLNEVCSYGWHRRHFMLGTDIYCEVGLVMPDGTIQWRADAGESDNDFQKTKTAASDSFKRAAKEFGLGLWLYDLDVISLPVKKEGNYTNIVREDGSKIWDLTKYITEEYTKKPKTPTKQAQKVTPKPAAPVKTEPAKAEPAKPSQANLTAGEVTPSTEFNTTPEEERKNKAKLAFGKLDKAKVLSHLIRNKNLKFTDINTFIEGTPIEDVLAIYDEVKEFKAK